MSGPAFVDVRTQTGEMVRSVFVPTCAEHFGGPWRGAPSTDRELAAFNAGIHNTDMHRAESGMLAGLDSL